MCDTELDDNKCKHSRLIKYDNETNDIYDDGLLIDRRIREQERIEEGVIKCGIDEDDDENGENCGASADIDFESRKLIIDNCVRGIYDNIFTTVLSSS